MPEHRTDGISRLMLFFAIVYTVEGFCQAKIGIIWQPLTHYLKQTQGWDAVQIAVPISPVIAPAPEQAPEPGAEAPEKLSVPPPPDIGEPSVSAPAPRVTTTRMDMGSGYELDVIAAVVLGGTSIFGGSGTIWGTVIGLAMIQLLKNGLALTGVKGDATIVVIGIALILSVLIASSLQRRRD